jgi:carbonic anhydrase
MKTTLKIFIVLIPIIKESFESTIEIKGAPPFCYEEVDCGPGSVRWPGICKSGENQSPIDLLHNFETMRLAEENPRKLHFNREYHTKQFYIRNNGHSIQISFHPNLTSNAEMSGHGFDNPYIFAQAHFHWGHDIRHGGSEHTINGVHLPVEIHFVHYDSKFISFGAAVASGN